MELPVSWKICYSLCFNRSEPYCTNTVRDSPCPEEVKICIDPFLAKGGREKVLLYPFHRWSETNSLAQESTYEACGSTGEPRNSVSHANAIIFPPRNHLSSPDPFSSSQASGLVQVFRKTLIPLCAVNNSVLHNRFRPE